MAGGHDGLMSRDGIGENGDSGPLRDSRGRSLHSTDGEHESAGGGRDAGRRRGIALPEMESLLEEGVVAGLPDRELLERWVSHRDRSGELAFTALVARHGPMVLGVCRRILRDPAEADDAFQATFLVLARRPARSGCGLARSLALRGQ